MTTKKLAQLTSIKEGILKSIAQASPGQRLMRLQVTLAGIDKSIEELLLGEPTLETTPKPKSHAQSKSDRLAYLNASKVGVSNAIAKADTNGKLTQLRATLVGIDASIEKLLLEQQPTDGPEPLLPPTEHRLKYPQMTNDEYAAAQRRLSHPPKLRILTETFQTNERGQRITPPLPPPMPKYCAPHSEWKEESVSQVVERPKSSKFCRLVSGLPPIE
jgi:hypothetical protein